MSYQSIIMKYTAMLGLDRPSTITDATIRHDDDCPLLARHGPCTCKPTVELTGRDAAGRRFRYFVNEDGALEADG